jgi:hypothetical protein
MPKSDRTVSKDLIAENDQMVTGWKNRIREELCRQKVSMKVVSRKAGLGDTTLQYILRNSDTVNLETMRRLANALGVQVEGAKTERSDAAVARLYAPRCAAALVSSGRKIRPAGLGQIETAAETPMAVMRLRSPLT